jgi:hypothetical protein
MSDTFTYTYTVLRYIHDVTTGEFVNVGVALYAPQARYASAQCRATYGRLNKVFPGMNGEHFRSLMRHIHARFEELGEQLVNELALSEPHNVMELAHSILPHDDSSLQWSTIGSGITSNPSETLDKLYERMVMQYDDHLHHRRHRNDQDVWRNFKHSLEARRLLHHFKPKRISVKDDEVEFKHAWKNGVWHCLEPLSFDLSEADNIRDKAHQWLGQITSIKDTNEPFKLYLLVGQPQEEQLRPAFDSALSILNKIDIDKQIILEQDADELTELIAKEVTSHEAGKLS